MFGDLPTLRIVPTGRIRLHEEYDAQRVSGIASEMRRQKMLTNPPIVARIRGRTALVLLDGANRVMAARKIGLPHILVQVVDYDDPAIVLSKWDHVVRGFPADDFFAAVLAMGGARVNQVDFAGARRLLDRRAISCFFHHRSRGTYALSHGPNLSEVGMLRDVTRIYKDRALILRVLIDTMRPQDIRKSDDVILGFPRFSKKDIVACALSRSEKLPTGISRHTIPGRALRVNLDLATLASSASLARKNRALDLLIEEKLKKKMIRLYSEPTFMYDD